MPTVSILIPAYRPDFLDACIASALAQTYTDFELLVSDDSVGGAIQSIVSKWQDPRLKYFKNPQLQLVGANADNLLSHATGAYAKFLFDDDLLFPRSIELLLHALHSSGAKIAFHNRHFIDHQGQVLHSPVVVAEGSMVLLSPERYFDELIGNAHNFIGEPTNILIDLTALRTIENPWGIDGYRIRFLTDVALFTNFASRNHSLVGVGYMGAGFRQHAGQNSSPTHPLSAAGLFEWELLMRWSVEEGHVKPDRYRAAIETLFRAYRVREGACPELKLFLELNGQREQEGYLGPRFRDALLVANMSIGLKQIARQTKP
jgi:glycosyltransferase involved in cell wall biosynthesis